MTDIIGTTADDYLLGTTGDDLIQGFGGNDLLTGNAHELLPVSWTRR